MITFLTSPKAFEGIAKVNQYRAIKSWIDSTEDAEVILYGDSTNIEVAGKELGVNVKKEIECSPSGLPYFKSIVEHAEKFGKYDLQIYLNCDILIKDISQILRSIDFDRFLLIGQCINLGEKIYIDPKQDHLYDKLRKLALNNKITLRETIAIDYFGFRRGTWKNLPPIVIGRAAYDSALLAYCQSHKYPLIDATYACTALHQFHGYDHVEGGKKVVWKGTDAKNNTIYAGKNSFSTISDAYYVLKDREIQYFPCRGDWLRKIELDIRYKYEMPNISLFIRILWRVLRLVGFPHIFEPNINEVIDNLEFADKNFRHD